MFLNSTPGENSCRPGRKFFRILLVAALVSLLSAVPVRADDDAAARRREFYDSLKILGDVYERIINNYVDETDPHEIMEAGINGMLEMLDPHSAYLPPVNYEDLMMSTEGEFGGLGISINVRIEDGLSPLLADRRALKQILLNLLTNSLKFTPAGGSIILRASADEDWMLISVADDGDGIAPELLADIMSPKTTMTTTPYKTAEGWGLGLNIVRGLAELHGGTVDIQSALGEGTTVTVKLPGAAA